MKKAFLGLGALFGFAFIVIVIGSYVIVAQTPITGEWTASVRQARAGDTLRDKKNREDDIETPWDLKDGVDKLQLNFRRSNDKEHENNFGSGIAFSDLQGLTRQQVESGGRVSFRIVREAGAVDLEGTFANGKGSGTYRFTPDMGFANGMKARGFDFEKSNSKHMNSDSLEDRLFSAAMLNVTVALADDLRSTGFKDLDVGDLYKATIFKIDSKFMSEMKNTGFPNLTMEDLVKARIFKIDADYVKQIHEMGLDNNDFEGLVKFRIFKVTPKFLDDLRSYGFTNLSAEEIVKFRIFNITPEFIQKAKAENPNVTVEDMVKMKIGVGRFRSNDN